MIPGTGSSNGFKTTTALRPWDEESTKTYAQNSKTSSSSTTKIRSSKLFSMNRKQKKHKKTKPLIHYNVQIDNIPEEQTVISERRRKTSDDVGTVRTTSSLPSLKNLKFKRSRKRDDMTTTSSPYHLEKSPLNHHDDDDDDVGTVRTISSLPSLKGLKLKKKKKNKHTTNFSYLEKTSKGAGGGASSTHHDDEDNTISSITSHGFSTVRSSIRESFLFHNNKKATIGDYSDGSSNASSIITNNTSSRSRSNNNKKEKHKRPNRLTRVLSEALLEISEEEDVRKSQKQVSQQQPSAEICLLWKADTALAMYFIIFLSMLYRNLWILFGVNVVLLYKMASILQKWVPYIINDDEVLEAIRISRTLFYRMRKEGANMFGDEMAVSNYLMASGWYGYNVGTNMLAKITRMKIKAMNEVTIDNMTQQLKLNHLSLTLQTVLAEGQQQFVERQEQLLTWCADYLPHIHSSISHHGGGKGSKGDNTSDCNTIDTHDDDDDDSVTIMGGWDAK